ncbi:Oidioi.mRNA.OKI2018_I69.chr1.g376.t1.cds [Oikopleura dioica]|uniref:Oidioi.mRNA.OKI2018_I69.chr1.g376.t1.cds n=1 Tax=Oikopleura dioica TaxID=34765 RepID=A0ABN7SNX3_OIKDI|nr:Oidioi.mRNA.OKI2018_I69.chr1.g376.t1.cds [Oikopleura dioica]
MGLFSWMKGASKKEKTSSDNTNLQSPQQNSSSSRSRVGSSNGKNGVNEDDVDDVYAGLKAAKRSGPRGSICQNPAGVYKNTTARKSIGEESSQMPKKNWRKTSVSKPTEEQLAYQKTRQQRPSIADLSFQMLDHAKILQQSQEFDRKEKQKPPLGQSGSLPRQRAPPAPRRSSVDVGMQSHNNRMKMMSRRGESIDLVTGDDGRFIPSQPRRRK